MKQIKYRSWISSLQKFVYFENGNYSWIRKTDNVNVFDWSKAEQYTGLKDKNGVEIYKGDYIKIKQFGKAKVIFLDGSFMAEWIEDEAYSVELSKMIWDNRSTNENIFKVIGTIHENKNISEENEQ